jgi:calcium-dependent protein kinase
MVTKANEIKLIDFGLSK